MTAQTCTMHVRQRGGGGGSGGGGGGGGDHAMRICVLPARDEVCVCGCVCRGGGGPDGGFRITLSMCSGLSKRYVLNRLTFCKQIRYVIVHHHESG